MQSAMYAGQTLLAAHFGLRDGRVLRWWFAVFDQARAELAPSWMLLRALMAAAPVTGLTRVDLGFGDEDYKRHEMTGSVSVCDGEATPQRVWQAAAAGAMRAVAPPGAAVPICAGRAWLVATKTGP